MTRLSLVGLLLFLSLAQAFAQNKTITGKVTDSKTGQPLAGATVQPKGSKTGVSTSAEGTFSINVSSNVTVLVITSVGYDAQNVTIGNETSINVSMSTSNTNLNEVVVIGYGTARKKDLTGSVTSVRAKDFNQGIITSPDQLLTGKVAGLEITNNSGQPGAATTIKIRGNNSIRANNNPLFVVDGVPLDGRTAKPGLDLGANGLPFGPTPESNPLLYINPNDIQQIDVLKDASSAAIYGSRGANGVVVITTKKGTSGPLKLDAGVSLGVFAGYMKQHKVLSASAFKAAAQANSLTGLDSGSSVNALNEITQHSLSQNYSLAISQGNENGKFRASFLGSNTLGSLKKTSLEKYLANLSGQYYFFDKKLTLDFNLITGHTNENMTNVSNTAGAGGNLLAYALNWNPTVPIRNKNGDYNLLAYSIPNPVAVSDGYNDVAKVNVFLANISASLKLMKGLDYKFLYSINHGAGTRATSMDGWLSGIQPISGAGLAVLGNAALTSQTFTHTLNYRTDLTSKIKFDAVAGYEYWKTDFSNSSVYGTNFNTNLDQHNRIPILYTAMFQNASTQYPLNTNVDPTVEIQSYFGRVNFNLLDKIYLTGTLRADGSNKFGSNNKYGYFPSVGARWVLSNEAFLKDSKLFSNLALRASWGITGNQEFPAGAALEQFTTGAYNSFGQSNVANPNLKWEQTQSVNIGLDFTILKGRIGASIDYYNKNTTNILFENNAIQPAPSSVFFINLPANIMNSGVEFAINAGIVQSEKFGWDASFNIAYNKNQLKNFNQAPILTGSISGPSLSGATAQVIANNQPIDVYYLKKFSGFDANGAQIIGASPVFAGDPNPHVNIGFSNTLRYKKLSFSFNMSGAFGFLIYNNTLNGVTDLYQLSKGQNIAEGQLGTGEKLSAASIAASTRYLEKGNYLKMRNMTFNYTFGNAGKYFKNINAFVTATNVFVITKYTGGDPEVNVDKTVNGYPSRSIDYIPFPTPRMVTFGFNFSL
jgi:iron complex outermembrane receptor protein